MCTVTFVPTKKGCILTSNRDETILRGQAIEPNEYIGNNKKLVYPRDPKANGTWIVHDYLNCAILLNGAEEKHHHRNDYRKSRGLILLDIFDSEDVLKEWDAIDLDNIEPFTVVLFYQQELFQLRWNETEKTKIKLSTEENNIWSSSTLYSKEIREHRQQMFKNHLENSNYTADEILNFHQFKDEEDSNNTIVIKRDEHLKTVSITQFNIENNKIKLNYIDLYE
ncbi:MAG: NRDE family protein [Flavobacterium sp.]|nr:NRDE family protein [Flavobacterium sp.]